VDTTVTAPRPLEHRHFDCNLPRSLPVPRVWLADASHNYDSLTVDTLHSLPNASFTVLPSFNAKHSKLLTPSFVLTTLLVARLYSVDGRITNERGAVGGMRTGWGNLSTRTTPAPVTLCPPQIPRYMGWNPNRRGGMLATNRQGHGTALGSLNKL
jgi:hypothetical protein